jgi:hypothetical protein
LLVPRRSEVVVLVVALGWWEAVPPEALVGMLVAAPFAWLVTRRLRRLGARRACARCGEGYLVEALEPLGRDGAHVLVRCPTCQVFYAVATTHRDVFKVDECDVAARWPDVPVKPSRPPSSLGFAED